VVRRGWADIEEAVQAAHRVFEGFREDVRHVIADADHVVVHFTISGRQVRPWGPIPATNRRVSYDEIVVMTIQEGKVVHQIGVADNLLALQQIGAVPDPSGFATASSDEA
jgi:predicted ester cyclase